MRSAAPGSISSYAASSTAGGSGPSYVDRENSAVILPEAGTAGADDRLSARGLGRFPRVIPRCFLLHRVDSMAESPPHALEAGLKSLVGGLSRYETSAIRRWSNINDRPHLSGIRDESPQLSIHVLPLVRLEPDICISTVAGAKKCIRRLVRLCALTIEGDGWRFGCSRRRRRATTYKRVIPSRSYRGSGH